MAHFDCAVSRRNRPASGAEIAGASVEEFYSARLQVVHGTSHFDRALRFQFSKDGAVLPDSSHGHLDVLSRDCIDEGVVLRRTFAGIGGGVYRGFDLRQQSRQVASNDWNDIIVGYFRLLEGIKERITRYILGSSMSERGHFRPSPRPLPAI